jgi:hypothetical protein
MRLYSAACAALEGSSEGPRTGVMLSPTRPAARGRGQIPTSFPHGAVRDDDREGRRHTGSGEPRVIRSPVTITNAGLRRLAFAMANSRFDVCSLAIVCPQGSVFARCSSSYRQPSARQPRSERSRCLPLRIRSRAEGSIASLATRPCRNRPRRPETAATNRTDSTA